MRIAIFHMEEIPTLFLLEKAARTVGFSPYLFHLRDVRFFADEKNMDLRVEEISLKDFSLVFVRGFWNYQAEVSLLAKFCKMFKIPLLDSALATEHVISKNNDLLILQWRGLPVIKTLFLENKDGADMIERELGFPLVAKEVRGKRGFDVHLLSNERQLREFLMQMGPEEKKLDTKTYQFQKFIPADFDVRVLVLDGKILGAIERRSSNPSDFRHSISLGGRATQIPVSRETSRLALAAARVLKYEFAGVDFITHRETGKTYLLEVNRSPGFEGFMQATGIDVPLQVMKFFLRFARKCIR